ncbi:MAG: hypothetical protein ABFS42_13620, partial [Candidatus Krumholzibacteriota bacterium]
AAEPLGRRVWPTMFVASSRLLSRSRIQWLDPVIGKSVLVGLLAAGTRLIIEGPLRWWVDYWLSGTPPRPLDYHLELLRGQREALSWIIDQSLFFGFILIFVMALIVIRMMVKRRVPTLALTLVAWTLFHGPSSLESLLFILANVVISLIVLLRWGVVAYLISLVMTQVGFMARAADWSAWHSQGAVLALLVMVAFAVYGAWAAMGGRRLKLEE